MKNLSSYIKQVTGLSEAAWKSVEGILTHRHYRKGEFLLQVGEQCHSIFYIRKGYCRAFYDFEGDTINTNFYFESEFATNIRSLKQSSGSEYAIQAEEDVDVVVMDQVALYKLFRTSVEIDAMGRKLMEVILAVQEKKAVLFKLNSARERYNYMREIQPNVIERVPLAHIASYIGVSMETLMSIHADNN